jgi:hypothetical protein
VTWLLGTSYLALPFSALLWRTSRVRKIARRLERPLIIVVLSTIGAILVTELSGGVVAMMILTSTEVLAMMILSTLLTSRLIVSLCGVLGRRGFP